MKKIFTLFALLLCAIASVHADDATITWAFTDASDLTSTNSPSADFLLTRFNYGTNLNLSKVTKNGKNNSWGASYDMLMFKPTKTVAKNTGELAENTLEFVIIPQAGITFTPTKVSFTGCNAGGTGDPKTVAYVVYSNGTKETVMEAANMNRDDRGTVTSPTNASKDLETAVAGKLTLRIYMDGLTDTSKGVAFTNIKVEGSVSGTPSEATPYTITVAANDASYGAVSGGGKYANGETGKLYAKAKDGAKFLKWQKGGADFEGNTNPALDIEVSADATYTAIFSPLYSITYAKGDATGAVPATGYVNPDDAYTVDAPYFLTVAGKTFTGWSDGNGNTYDIGETIASVSSNVTLTAQYATNTVALGDAATTVNWSFARESGAPTINWEGTDGNNYVQRATIGDSKLDIAMNVNTKKGAAIDKTTGKLNNTTNAGYAQVNQGTLFSFPAVKGMVVSYTYCNGTPNKTQIGFTDNGSDLTTLTDADAVNTTTKVISYTYTGTASTLYMVERNGNVYPSGIKVFYPATSVAITPAKEYTTYVTSQALDFTDVDGLTAYIATAATTSAVSMTKVNKVPANTPIVIKAATTGSPINVPVATSTDDVAANKLVAGDGTTNVGGADVYDYILVDGQFYHASPAAPVAVGKAYLHLATAPASPAPMLSLDFGEGTTGINAVKTVDGADNTYYNLNGQRVAQPGKGLYIVNGKKVIIK